MNAEGSAPEVLPRTEWEGYAGTRARVHAITLLGSKDSMSLVSLLFDEHKAKHEARLEDLGSGYLRSRHFVMFRFQHSFSRA